MHNSTKNPDLPPIWYAFVHLHWLNLVLNRSRLEDVWKKKKSRFIVNTKPALERILTQNTSIQAKNTTNERPIQAEEAEGSGNSDAAAEARNNKQQVEYFVDAEFPPLRSVGR